MTAAARAARVRRKRLLVAALRAGVLPSPAPAASPAPARPESPPRLRRGA